ncbi:Uncharacterised protein g7842 [Pycnogonum litorale]
MFGYRMNVFWIALIMIIDGSESEETLEEYDYNQHCGQFYFPTEPYCQTATEKKYRFRSNDNVCTIEFYCPSSERVNYNRYDTEDECNKKCKKENIGNGKDKSTDSNSKPATTSIYDDDTIGWFSTEYEVEVENSA